MPDLVASNKVMSSKLCTAGNVYLIEMPVNMYVVLCYSEEETQVPIFSRVFFFDEINRKIVLSQARKTYNKIKYHLEKKNLHLIEELE
ncbi:MAG: hypothetical protein HUJ68_09960 [Clostridia bacterium]|nr:hypothetical protein [Clostridia bacterium]